MQVHRCRFVDYVPQSINAIKFAPSTSAYPYVAVGRANGDIELWRTKGNLVHEKTIPGIASGSLETLTWAHQTELTADDLEFFDTDKERSDARARLVESAPRLFSAGLNAVIVEWDLAKLVPKSAVDSFGGAVWCMATNHAQTKLAVGTEDGHIRIFDITNGGLVYKSCFDKINSRILSVAWSQDDKTIVTGSADSCVRIWDAKTRHTVTRMTLPKEGRDSTLVWSVIVLKSGTIVSGDSRGRVTFWDSVMHVVEQDFRALGADVLCLTADDSGHTVFASGVDPKITQFKLLAGSSVVDAATSSNSNGIGSGKKKLSIRSKKWQLAGFRRYHTHDVRAIAVSSHLPSDLIISGGTDTQVAYCQSRPFPNENPHRQPCFPPLNSVISVASKAKLILQRQGCTLKLWALGKAEPASKLLADQMESGQALQVYQRQRDLLRMDLTTKTNILCSTISPSGNLIAASDAEGPKLFSVVYADDSRSSVRVRRLREFPPRDFVPDLSEHHGAVHMRFTDDETKIVVATVEGYVSIIDISGWRLRQFATIRRHCGHRTAESEVETDVGSGDVPTHAGQARRQAAVAVETRTITCMAISKGGDYVATSDSTGSIVVSQISGEQQLLVPQLGQGERSEWPTTLSFDEQARLVIPTSLNHLYVFDIAENEFTEWSRQHSLSDIPLAYNQMVDCVGGVATNPDEPDCIYAWSASHITRVDLTLPPGPKRAVLNVHKRKQIEHEIIAKVVEEKEEADRRSEKQAKRKRRQSSGGQINGHVVVEEDKESDAPSIAEKADAAAAEKADAAAAEKAAAADEEDDGSESDEPYKGKDWESTVIARLREAGINAEKPHNFRMTQRYQNLMHASFIDANTMVVVERPWIDVAATLPSAYHRHKYGA
ncbi:U3 small nucleolar RNA-associated protein [Coemansia thaxteri]|uniref:U3 small nucleolar RNA-associated protein n=1 Tax=Coemansia thaxteri TaxID=2663907 RepID=A0A9W8BGM9_9FUNG|nr:U3 small nucleolar RNA-associated protein [Coemansia thaxteri]KAJ2008564.1 U3 small nucleolar RNA-associated protein [Coemansia thaxteri]